MTSFPKVLVLASTSPYKRRLLERLGIPFLVDSPEAVEERHPQETPEQMASRLAQEKALSLRVSHGEAFLLGADQVIALGDQIFSKPGTVQGAEHQLALLSGKTHTLLTAMALCTPTGEVLESMVQFEMEMRPLTEAEIRRYVALDQPLDCAGSYKIESYGIGLFRNTKGPDHTAIEGLAITRVRALLEAGGFFL